MGNPFSKSEQTPAEKEQGQQRNNISGGKSQKPKKKGKGKGKKK